VLEGMLGTLAQEMQALDASTRQEAGMDATGMETSGASVHYRTRKGSKRKASLKLSAVVLFGSLVPAAIALDMGRAMINGRRATCYPRRATRSGRMFCTPTPGMTPNGSTDSVTRIGAFPV